MDDHSRFNHCTPTPDGGRQKSIQNALRPEKLKAVSMTTEYDEYKALDKCVQDSEEQW